MDPQAAILKGEPAPGAVVFEAKYSNVQYKSLEDVTEHTLLRTHTHCCALTHTAAHSHTAAQPLLSLVILPLCCVPTHDADSVLRATHDAASVLRANLQLFSGG